jgi:hypothetical protein
LPVLSGAELKVLIYIARRTFGFKKRSDKISLSQITRGIVTRSGKRLDGGTGLTKSTAACAIRGLVDKNIIVKVRNTTPHRGNVPSTYALNLLPDGPQTCPSRKLACASPGSHMREVTFFVTTGNGERFKGADGVLARDTRRACRRPEPPASSPLPVPCREPRTLAQNRLNSSDQ